MRGWGHRPVLRRFSDMREPPVWRAGGLSGGRGRGQLHPPPHPPSGAGPGTTRYFTLTIETKVTDRRKNFLRFFYEFLLPSVSESDLYFCNFFHFCVHVHGYLLALLQRYSISTISVHNRIHTACKWRGRCDICSADKLTHRSGQKKSLKDSCSLAKQTIKLVSKNW